MDAREPTLEAAILRDPDDLASFAVYGDWLAEHGDPRGELIATQLAADASGDPELRRAALRVFARNRERFLGALGETIAAEAFTWRAGFIHRAELSHDRLLFVDGARVAATMADVVAQLLAHPSARFLSDLSVLAVDRDRWGRPLGTFVEVVDRIAAARPAALRRLQLGDPGYGVAQLGSLEPLWPALPQLRELVAHGELALGDGALPELRRVSLAPASLRRRAAAQLARAAWPRLEELHITFGGYPHAIARELSAFVARADLPHLAHLALVGYQVCDELVEALVGSPVLARLRVLELPHGVLSERGARTLLAHAGAFAHLARLDLTGSAQLARATFTRLRRALPSTIGP